MKRPLQILASFIVLTGSLLLLVAPNARGEDIITDAQLTTIRNNCADLQATLHRLQQTDTLLRYDRGQLYLTISDKLMIPLNQRIASNQLNGSDLVTVSADYSQAYQKFYDAYKTYDTALSNALSIDCTRQPTQFYDAVADARQRRLKLHDASTNLVGLAKNYLTQFNDFSKQFEKGKAK